MKRKKVIAAFLAVSWLLIMLGVVETKRPQIVISPPVITTQTTFNVTVEETPQHLTNPKQYNFSLESCSRTASEEGIVSFQCPQEGHYKVMASVLHNSTWRPWAVKEIIVFDHEIVTKSNCVIRIVYAKKMNRINSTLALKFNVSLNSCYGSGEFRVNEIGNTKSRALVAPSFREEFVSFGNLKKAYFILRNISCNVLQALVTLKTPTGTVFKQKDINLSPDSRTCQNESAGSTNPLNGSVPVQNSTDVVTDSTANGTEVIVYGTLNPIIGIFFCFVFIIYLTNGVIAYRGYKDLLKPLQNLTNPEDNYTYELQVQVGNGFSTQSSQCEVLFTAFGTDDVIGPISLPSLSFEHDGIASFLLSTSKDVGDIGTIGLFCANMDPRSDLFLRMIKIFRHSQKPDGNHWGDDDAIEKVAEFDCHSWFSPTIPSHSVGQTFNQSTERCEKSFLVDYFNRCSQLFFQKHILTTWRCSFGVESFTKVQRLSFLFTMWFLLIYLATLFVVTKGIDEFPTRAHMYQIGIIRLDRRTFDFTIISALATYVAGVGMCLVVKTFYGVSDDDGYGSRRHIHIDSTRSGHPQPKAEVKVDEDATKNDTLTASKDTNSGCSSGSLEYQCSLVPKTATQCLPENGVSKKELHKERNLGRETADGPLVTSSFDANRECGMLDNSLHTESVVLDLENENVGGREKVATDLDHIKGRGVTNGYAEGLCGNHVINGGFDSTAITRSSDSVNFAAQGEAEERSVLREEKDPVAVQFYNRETIVVGKENLLKAFAVKFSRRIFWIIHSVFLMSCTFHTLVVSVDWNSDTAFHWLSMHFVSFFISCLFLDTIRVLGYIFSITIKERKTLKSFERRTPFEKYAKLLLASKLAAKERNMFCLKEYSEERMKTLQNYSRLRGKFRELFLFSFFVIVLFINTTWTINEDSFRFWASLRNFALHTNEVTEIQSEGETVDPAVNFWSWANKTLQPLLDIKKRDISLQQLHLMGQAVILTQRRVKKGRCSIPEEMMDFVEDCSAEFQEEDEDRQAYAPGWKHPGQGVDGTSSPQGWQWVQSQIEGVDAKGYRVEFVSSNLVTTIDSLMRKAWIDRYTRRLTLQMLIYNPSANLIASVDIILKFSTSGSIRITDKFFNFVFSTELSNARAITHLAETVLFAMTVYLIFDIVKRKKRTSTTWLSGWLILQVTMVILSIIVVSMMIYRHHLLYSLGIQSTMLEKMGILYTILSTLEMYEFLLANLSALSFFLVLKPLFTLGLFDDMYIAIVRTVSGLKGIAMETVIVLIGFGCWANLAFTSSISNFSTMDFTFATLMDMLVRPDQEDLDDVPFYGPLFLFTYFIAMVLLVSNLVISSVEQSYSEARRAFDGMRRRTVLKVFMKRFKKRKQGAAAIEKYDLTLRSTMSRKPLHVLENQADSVANEGSIQSGASSPTDNDGPKEKKVNDQDEFPRETDLLQQRIERIEQIVAKKILFEHASDKLMISALADKWDKHVLRRPSFDVICMYRPLIRIARTETNRSKLTKKGTGGSTGFLEGASVALNGKL